MDLIAVANNIAGSIAAVARSHPIISLTALIVIALLIYRRPRFFIILLLVIVLLVGVLYAVSTLVSSGSTKKERLIEKSAPEIFSATHGVWI